MMSEEVQCRALEEDPESEEGDLESYLEEESSSELLERVRELQAENSALSLANESQREAYERCLDEVANHVVQALLNQKDLREECIKLKMRVFDLERQNRTLCELLQEKLHNQSCVHQQTGSCLEHITELQHSDVSKLIETQKNAQAKGNGECAQNCFPDTQSSAASMEALSPFLKKKAHILEVLRKLEETDPLRYHRSSGISSLCEYSQALVSKDTMLACRDNSSRCNASKTHCSHSCSDLCTHQHLNGGEHNSAKCGSCSTCLILSNKDSVGLANSSHNCCTSTAVNIDNLNLASPECHKSQDLQSLTKPTAGTSEDVVNRKSAGVSVSSSEQSLDPSSEPVPKEGSDSLPKLPVAERDQNRVPDHEPPTSFATIERGAKDNNRISDVPVDSESSKRSSGSTCDEQIIDANITSASLPEKDFKHLNVVASERLDKVTGHEELSQKDDTNVYTVHPTISKLPTLGLKESLQEAYCESDSSKLVHKGLLFSPNENQTASRVLDEICVPVKDSIPQDHQADRSKLVSPNQVSCLREVKASPSKLLKFLKIPTIGERSPAANTPRLSPQLARSSKIPCRSNNYEVHHSPVAVRKATTTERQKQSPGPKSETYPTAHSAPTSPPQPDEPPPVVPKEVNISKNSRGGKLAQTGTPQKNIRKIPHYENVADLSVSASSTDISQVLGEVSTALRHASSNTERVKAKQGHFAGEKPTSVKSQKDTSPGSDISDQEESSDSPVWHKQVNHRSLPTQSSSQKSQLGISTRSKSQEKNEPVKDQSQNAGSPIKRNDPPPIPKKTGTGRHANESSHSFKERLAALGKLRNQEESVACSQSAEKRELQSSVGVHPRPSDKIKNADRNSDCKTGEHRLSKNTDSIEEKPYVSGQMDSAISKQAQFQPADQGIKSLPVSSVISKLENESSRMSLAKPESPKSKMPPPTSNLEAVQALRSYAKSATPHSLSYGGKNIASPHSGSPNKIPLKSPTKTVPPSLNRDGKPSQELPKYLSKSEDRSQLRASKKKNSSGGDSLPPPPPRPVESGEEKRHSAPSPQSSIEQKVMKGIEENMLKLQEQDKGQVTEVKQKASSGIANWFGLRKSKLPALSRKPETSKGKDDKREWKLNISSVGKDTKVPAKKPESESLNISMLMEKAEGLHKALEEERAYVNGVALDRQGKGHSCEVVMDQVQGQLSVMYRGVPSDNFMQQLLNRVDGKDVGGISVAHRRLSFDCKVRPVFSHGTAGVSQTRSREDMEKSSALISKVDGVSDENLADSMHHEHFAGSGISTHTLDSGIGTFPLPDYSANAGCKNTPKVKAQGENEPPLPQGSGVKIPHKAWNLERELSSLEEDYIMGQEMDSTTLEGKIASSQVSDMCLEGTDVCGAPMRSGPTKNWTFPNPKGSTDSSDVYLGVGKVLEPVTEKSSFRRRTKTGEAAVGRDSETAQVRRGKGRGPGNPDAVREPGLELVRERPDDALSPGHPQVLETPESLSDSLYDSLSSCGSQG
ncbi:nck-associated protein 5-like [Electrophorus electricus]|uniref:nck-associated protein 5-like n=1 Tax=Electrophorus electricus TaxID=8005 RepID=UPI0015D03251|nr:nck-associated protein 5-like [Electrophorus electricus]XP_026867756.2 nck-associated protein 5-like [Electrophorus electricus]XP_026867757.2 nck-associated protein 5-like [Electrophorus electricus]